MKDKILELIEIACEEDLNEMGDVTSSAIFQNEKDHFYLLAKDTGILCGIEIFEKIFHAVEPKIIIKTNFHDGDKIQSKKITATIQGNVAAILQAERTALNLLSHLSGIASKTNEFVKLTKGKTKILDTRKTLPGLRKLQKYAVRCGGGENHRMGLYDMVMIKDNHIDAAGCIDNAVKEVRKKWGNKFKIEVETRNLSEVQQALNSGADRIMLDNMNLKMMQKAVNLISDRVETEASGNMTLDRISEVSQTGVDYISVGELTHTIKAFDFSLRRGTK